MEPFYVNLVILLSTCFHAGQTELICEAQQELSFHVSSHYGSHQSPRTDPPPMWSLQSLASMLTMVAIAALRTCAVVRKCSWMWCLIVVGSRSAPHEGKWWWCAATSWKIALMRASLDFWGVFAPNMIPMMVCSLKLLMLLHLIMLMLPGEQNFMAFMGWQMLPSSKWWNIIPRQVMSNIQERRKTFDTMI